MTVRKLIEELEKLDKDTPIWVLSTRYVPSSPEIDVVNEDDVDWFSDTPLCNEMKVGDYIIRPE